MTYIDVDASDSRQGRLQKIAAAWFGLQGMWEWLNLLSLLFGWAGVVLRMSAIVASGRWSQQGHIMTNSTREPTTTLPPTLAPTTIGHNSMCGMSHCSDQVSQHSLEAVLKMVLRISLVGGKVDADISDSTIDR